MVIAGNSASDKGDRQMETTPQVNAVASAVAAAIPAFANVTIASVTRFDAEKMFSHVMPYSATASAVEGYRHSVIRYRVTGTNKVEKPAKMVTVPQIKLTDDYLLPDVAAKVLVGCLEDQQDATIREFVDSGKVIVPWDVLTLDETLKQLTAVRTSNRLSKELIENWVIAALSETLGTRGRQIAEEKGYNAEQTAKQIAGTLNAYKERFCKLAAPVPNLGGSEATALKNILAVANVDDDMSRALSTKIEAILHPVVAETGDL